MEDVTTTITELVSVAVCLVCACVGVGMLELVTIEMLILNN